MRVEALAEAVALAIKAVTGPIAARVVELEARSARSGELADLTARIAALEARAPEPGPMGPQGPAGANGIDGKDGGPGLSYCGVYVRGKEYDAGEIVTAGGSAFHCNRLTTAAPGSSPDWTLMVKRGQDGRDAGGRT